MRSRNRAALAAAVLLAGCAGHERPSGPAAGAVAPFDLVGYATWYGKELAGKRTASGERFDPDGITAAHRTLPLGTIAEVMSLDTGRAILVRINDRGPFTPGLMLDLSRGAAEALGSGGRTPVRVRSVTVFDRDRERLFRGRAAAARPAASAALIAEQRRRLVGRDAAPRGGYGDAAVR